jgi:hypothetical protein
MSFKNFKIWRGKLPHWRADSVTYYVIFRHRRELDQAEREVLLRHLVKPDGRRWELQILCVLPERTELIFRVLEGPNGAPYELSEIVEKAKSKAGKLISKKTGERFPPFYAESYDRIIRDEVELEQRWQEIFDAPITLELAEDADEYSTLWVADAPE